MRSKWFIYHGKTYDKAMKSLGKSSEHPLKTSIDLETLETPSCVWVNCNNSLT